MHKKRRFLFGEIFLMYLIKKYLTFMDKIDIINFDMSVLKDRQDNINKLEDTV